MSAPEHVTDPCTEPELVVLAGEDGTPIGSALKSEVHTDSTPLHFAFSTYVLGPDGRMLISRRALGKKTWPGVWTNACCGHPGVGESNESAIARRMRDELGLPVSGIRPAVPDFRYRAVDFSGIVENEFCPVFLAETTGDPSPDPEEVMDWAWIAPADLVTAMQAAPMVFSPWSVKQVAQMLDRGVFPGAERD